jgi:hypothetical protein
MAAPQYRIKLCIAEDTRMDVETVKRKSVPNFPAEDDEDIATTAFAIYSTKAAADVDNAPLRDLLSERAMTSALSTANR